MNADVFERTKNSIWITSHCRMVAEKRYRTYDNVSSFLLSWLSLAVLAWAVVHKTINANLFLDTYTALISVFVFAFSIITFGFRFGETSVLYRECYLRLQKLLDCESDPERLVFEYHEILGGYANHGDKDLDALVIQRTLLTKREIRGGDGKNIIWTGAMLARFTARNIAFWSVAFGIFLLGLMPYYVILKQI
jgi:hypothetical protein